MMISEIYKFISACPHLSGRTININHLGHSIGSISLENSGMGNVVKEYTDGTKLYSVLLTLAIRDASTRSTNINLRPIELLEAFSVWLEAENRQGNLPEATTSFIPLTVRVTGAPKLKNASDLTARYEISFELVYCETGL